MLTGCGAFAICGALCDWEWFMNHRKAKAFVHMFGRNGARVLYGLVGTGLVVLGTLMVLGIVQESK
jgi:hypothetical protein